ncbi:hypothetical protein I5R65_09355 [Herbaspirillum sp. AP02]|uniref:hypothetical protein n=1 Tax=unclassified Herbaspirillum TaxID=2624150 RepID=UPI0015DA45D9|nr:MULTISPECIES: hypothetical protein [unclassified Herbaspirillum]MBG7619666.1 hypothetical protein [Herbaspirillum sp. AP02]NZD69567.1 hypothetical protein [Herbaspirillum sp. AP21]
MFLAIKNNLKKDGYFSDLSVQIRCVLNFFTNAPKKCVFVLVIFSSMSRICRIVNAKNKKAGGAHFALGAVSPGTLSVSTEK